MLSIVFAVMCLLVAVMITAFEPRLTARSIRLAHSRGGDLPESLGVVESLQVADALRPITRL